MANSLRAKISKLRHDGNITDAEYQELIKKLDGHDKQIRAEVIDEIETKLVDIILGNEEFTDWQKQEISLCLECVIEQLKEQNENI